jgi:RNA polymerase sigma-70 factor, ECF subfamily
LAARDDHVKDTGHEALEDAHLSEQAAGGDRHAFAVLIERHYERLFRMAWAWTGNETEAEDIAQDVCVKLGSAIRSYRGDSAFPTWLHRVAYNVMIDRARIRRHETLPGTDNVIALFDRVDTTTPETALIGAELWTAVRALPNQQRDAVLLIYAQDLTHAEASEVMGCSEKTVSWHLHEAKKRLKGMLEAAG